MPGDSIQTVEHRSSAAVSDLLLMIDVEDVMAHVPHVGHVG